MKTITKTYSLNKGLIKKIEELSRAWDVNSTSETIRVCINNSYDKTFSPAYRRAAKGEEEAGG